MVLALAIHTVPDRPSAKIALSMIALLDLTNPRSKGKALSPELKCRQIFPTSGQRSSSLWDVPSIEVLQAWLDEELDCQSEVYEVQEDFAYGISAELTRVRTTERVTQSARAIGAAVGERTKPATDAASAAATDVDSKYKISAHSAAALKAAQDTSAVAARNTAAAFNNVSLAAKEQYAKALQNERVAAAAKSAGQVTQQLGTNLRNLGNTWWGTKSSQGSPTTSEASGDLGHAAQHEAPPPVHMSGFKDSAAPARSAPSAAYKPQPQQHSTAHGDEGDMFTLGDLEHADHASPGQLPPS